ncbi:MAG: hypothetical protein WC152_01965 [Candidatus Izemoplasmatales bacterium]
MKKISEQNQKNLVLLSQYVPIVNRVHGKNHKEFAKVKEIFYQINEKISNQIFNLDDEFKHLRVTTNNYSVPSDVCESYEAVYNMLKQLDLELYEG